MVTWQHKVTIHELLNEGNISRWQQPTNSCCPRLHQINLYEQDEYLAHTNQNILNWNKLWHMLYIYNYFSLLLEKPFVWLNWGWASQCTYLYRYGWNWLGDKGLTAQGSTCVVNNQGLKSISKRREWEKDITGITLFPLSKQDHMNSVKLELMLD